MLKPKNPFTANTLGFQLKLKTKILRERQTEKIERETEKVERETERLTDRENRDRETDRQRK
jgi:hypothetical protein